MPTNREVKTAKGTMIYYVTSETCDGHDEAITTIKHFHSVTEALNYFEKLGADARGDGWCSTYIGLYSLALDTLITSKITDKVMDHDDDGDDLDEEPEEDDEEGLNQTHGRPT